MNPPKRKKADPFVQKEKTRHVERSQCKCKSDVRRPSIPLSVREGEEGRRRDGIRWGCLPLSSRVSRGHDEKPHTVALLERGLTIGVVPRFLHRREHFQRGGIDLVPFVYRFLLPFQPLLPRSFCS